MPADHSYGATILKVENVSLSLGGRLILRDVNLEIKDVRRPGMTVGQVVGLLGPSGIGKTQLFKILAGLNPPDSGSVRLGEKAEPVRRGMVGVVAQSYPLFAHRTVLGNLVVAGRQAELSREAAKAKAYDYLKRFRLEEHGRKYPSQLSGGQRQRVAIARSTIHDPSVILADEPTASLDTERAFQVTKLYADLIHEKNRAGIMVTHDLRMCKYVDRIIQIEDGKIISILNDRPSIEALISCA
jgi:polar amino acid transport system ATP-binding protein/sulfate transport system ATP-binding protein